MRGTCSAVAALILCAFSAFAGDAVAPPPPQGYGRFVLSPKLEPRVLFWVDIYAKYHTWETLLVDLHYPQLVFSVIDTREKSVSVGKERQKVIAAIKKVAAKWDDIESGKFRRNKLKPAELLVVEAIEKTGFVNELRAVAADPARNVRAQSGLRDALEDSLFASGKYLPPMEALFTRFGLPPEIAYLPFVESGFNRRAISKVGASGIWQFMPYTGRLYLRVDDVVDERNDPMRAAEAAARLMKQNFDLLGDWPLAITAYNHGATGVARATREASTRDIVEIIEKYDSRSFGFASQNFYACFLAALHVAKNADKYLGSAVPRAKKLEFDEFVMPDYMALSDFLSKMDIDETIFRELNPALTEEVYKGNKFVPVGYIVRVPAESSAGFLVRYDAIPDVFKYREQKVPSPLDMEIRDPASVAPVESHAEGGNP